MTPGQLDRLFVPFEQGDGSTTRQFGGTGLGLAISHHLAELMGGRIDVTSVPDQGTTFVLTLPMIETTAANPAAKAPVSDQPQLAGLRILVAEDVELNRIVLAELLEEEGAELVFAENGRLALDRVENEGPDAFDLVLMDIQMPVMDGFEATRRLRERAPRLPVIGLTAHALSEEREKCLAAGMVEHVTKPIDPDILVTAVRRHVAHALPPPGERPPVVAPAPAEPAQDEIDREAISRRFNGNEAFIDKLLTTIVTSQGETASSLSAAADRGDHDAMAFISHSIKGMAGNIDAHGLYDLARNAESSARAKTEDAASLARQLADRLDQLLTRLRARPADAGQA